MGNALSGARIAPMCSCTGEGSGTPLQYSCLENPRDWESLVGCRLWGRTESDTTEVTQQQQCTRTLTHGICSSPHTVPVIHTQSEQARTMAGDRQEGG